MIINNRNLTLGRDGKDKLRAACRAHPDWKIWSLQNDIHGQPSKSDMFDFADHIGFDIAGMLDDMGQTSQPKPVTPAPAPAPAPVTSTDDDDDDDTPDGGDVAPLADMATLAADALADVESVLAGPMVTTLRDNVVVALTKAADVAKAEAESDVAALVAAQTTQAGGRSAPVLPPARKTGTETLKKLFGVTGKWADVALPVYTGGQTVKSNPAYVFDNALTGKVAAMWNRGFHVWLGGPKGSGKSTLPYEIAARTGSEITVIEFHENLDPNEIVGGKGMDANGTFDEYGALTKAIVRPGMIVVLDEMDRASARMLPFIHTLLASGFMTMPWGERVTVAPGVRFIATGNSLGSGDPTGLYNAVQELDGALMSRFGPVIEVSFLNERQERKALADTLGWSEDRVAPLTRYAALNRQAVTDGRTQEAVDFRMLKAWATALDVGFNDTEAFESCVQNKMKPEWGLVARDLLKADWTADDGKTVRGEQITPAPKIAEGQPFDVLADDDADGIIDIVT
jgi:MoxR-like ATPase